MSCKHLVKRKNSSVYHYRIIAPTDLKSVLIQQSLEISLSTMSLKDADVIHSGTPLFVSGTDQNGDPGNICEHNQGLGSSWSSFDSQRGKTEVGSVHSTSDQWINKTDENY